MATYRDSEDREWQVSITTYEVQQCKKRIDFNLCAIFDNELDGFRTLCNDTERMGAVLWVVCGEQAEKRNVSERSFLTALAGDAIDSALGAIKEALLDFFPPRVRSQLKDIYRDNDRRLEQQDKIHRAIMDMADRSEGHIDEVIKAITGAVEQTNIPRLPMGNNSTATSSRSPASVESIPDHSLSAS